MKLWPDGIRRQKLLLFVSDAAPYMKAAGQLLKGNYKYVKLLQVTYLPHGLHLVAEEIHGTYGLVNDVIAETKAVFTKSPRRKRIFYQYTPNIPLLLRPIVTRWGEWLKAASYYSDYFEEVRRVIEQLDPDGTAVNHAQQLWASPNLRREFNFILENYGFITSAITQFEGRGISLRQSACIFTDIAMTIHRNPVIPENIKLKIEKLFLNNTRFSIDLLNICRGLQEAPNQVISNEWNHADIQWMRYEPKTPCKVKRFFSRFKSILRSNRQSLTTENLKKLVVVYFNQVELLD